MSDDKAFFTAAAVIIISFVVAYMYTTYKDAELAKEAMSNGYIQNAERIWIKTNN